MVSVVEDAGAKRNRSTSVTAVAPQTTMSTSAHTLRSAVMSDRSPDLHTLAASRPFQIHQLLGPSTSRVIPSHQKQVFLRDPRLASVGLIVPAGVSARGKARRTPLGIVYGLARAGRHRNFVVTMMRPALDGLEISGANTHGCLQLCLQAFAAPMGLRRGRLIIKCWMAQSQRIGSVSRPGQLGVRRAEVPIGADRG